MEPVRLELPKTHHGCSNDVFANMGSWNPHVLPSLTFFQLPNLAV